MPNPTLLLSDGAYTTYFSSNETTQVNYLPKKRKISEVCEHREDNGNPAVVDVNECGPETRDDGAQEFLNRRKLDLILKKECDALIHLMDEAKIWLIISYSSAAPVTDFQDDILAEFHRAQESALNIRDVTRKYHLGRAKICSKLIKYPGVKDYKYALKEYDEQQLYLVHQHLRDIRNIYVVLNDMVKRSLTMET